jgi:hypothetical protein
MFTYEAVVSLLEAFLLTGSIVAGTPEAHRLQIFNTVTVALTTTTNITVTTMISIRLWLMYRRISINLEPRMASIYKDVLAIFIESAVPWTALGIAVCAVTPNASPVWDAVSLVWTSFGVSNHFLVALRLSIS